jgi:hypothetical protein
MSEAEVTKSHYHSEQIGSIVLLRGVGPQSSLSQ